jgi:hypothetical protein
VNNIKMVLEEIAMECVDWIHDLGFESVVGCCECGDECVVIHKMLKFCQLAKQPFSGRTVLHGVIKFPRAINRVS